MVRWYWYWCFAPQPQPSTILYLPDEDTLGDGVQNTYINALKSQIEMLERELEDRKEEARRYQHLLAAALERIPALEEPPDTPPEPSQTRDSAPEEPETKPPDTERRSWWRRWFGV